MWWIRTFLCVAWVGMLGAGAGWGQAKDDKIAGRTFEQWVKELNTKDPSRKEQAIRAMVGFAPEVSVKALPYLLAELKRHVPATPLDLSLRVNLCMAVAEVFTSGQKIDTRSEAEAVILVTRLLRDNQAIVRFRAAQGLAAIGPAAKPATNELLAMLKDQTTWEIRQAACSALGAISPDKTTGPPIPVLQALYGMLNDVSFQVRIAAIQAITLLGPPPDQAAMLSYIKSLHTVSLKDPEPSLQIWARVGVMGATNDFGADSLAPIAKLMAHSDAVVRANAAQALGAIGPKAKATVLGLTNLLTDPDHIVALSAMWALGRMETSAAVALPILEKMAADLNLPDALKKGAKEAANKIKGS